MEKEIFATDISIGLGNGKISIDKVDHSMALILKIH